MRWRAGRSIPVITLALAGALLAGCSSSSDQAGAGRQASPLAEQAGTPGGADDDGSGDGSGGAPALRVQVRDRAVIYTGALTVEVDDVSAALQRIEAQATAADGLVADEQTDNTVDRIGPDGLTRRQIASATIVVRVPPDAYARMLAAIGELGTVVQQSRGAKDVTEDIVDVESRVKSAEASVARIRRLMDGANALSDVVTLESELTRRQSDLESLQSRRVALAGQVDLATITATLVLSEPAPVQPDEESDLGFLSGLRASWTALTGATQIVLTIAGALLPFAAVVAIVGIPLLLVLRRYRRPPVPVTPERSE
ncbi:MAG TPA: DUF4349 domain-containing protein [Actinomycetes bacterium]|nr:DUF4349 domain-containing protein [Actinomycetes bacterium]